jgi:benzoyl-CoA reductase/2-hydroxyglutaryl-CoA dehydratase subunit BcrC/BadD/HgdB
MKSIAYSSPFVPAEWITAHGFRPHRLRLRATEQQPLAAVTRGVCPYVGALIDAALAGLGAAGLVLTTVCDQMRYAAALLESRNTGPIFLLNVPSTWQTAEVRELYFQELQRLGRFLKRLDGKTPDNAELTRIMFANDRMLGIDSRGSAASETASGVPLAVVGGPLLDADYAMFDLIEQAGGRVVLDATEGSERTMPRPFDPARVAFDPLRELADAYFDGIPDAFRRPNSRLYEWLKRELAARRARGIIFRRYVWCDLWHAELHRLRQWSPVPVLEIDVGRDDISNPNRVLGRIEAFLEMLR